jgi:hypothetical protein
MEMQGTLSPQRKLCNKTIMLCLCDIKVFMFTCASFLKWQNDETMHIRPSTSRFIFWTVYRISIKFGKGGVHGKRGSVVSWNTML